MIVVLKSDYADKERDGVLDFINSRAESCRSAQLEGRQVVFVERPADRAALKESLETQDNVERVIEVSSSSEMNRRSFLDFLIAGAGGSLTLGLLASVGLFVIPPKKVLDPSGEVAINKSDVPVGGAKNFMMHNRPAIVIESYGNYYAMSSTCTHSEICTVEWSVEKQQLICPCHRGVFDVRGNVLEGPPPRALPIFKVTVIDDKIFIGEPV